MRAMRDLRGIVPPAAVVAIVAGCTGESVVIDEPAVLKRASAALAEAQKLYEEWREADAREDVAERKRLAPLVRERFHAARKDYEWLYERHSSPDSDGDGPRTVHAGYEFLETDLVEIMRKLEHATKDAHVGE